MSLEPAFIFHLYKKKKIIKLIERLERISDDDPTKKYIPALIEYTRIAKTFEKRWGEDNDEATLSKGAMKQLWEKAKTEAELE